MSLERIFVPTDFSAAAERALEQATVLARRFGSKVRLFHRPIYRVPEPPPAGVDEAARLAALDRIMETYLTDPRREAEEQLDARVERLEAAGIRADGTMETTKELFRALQDAITDWKPDLVCMGTHGRGGMQKLLMGSVAEKVLRHAACNVLTLRDTAALAGAREDGAMQVLVPVDFSDYSQRALGVARELTANVSGSALYLLHVVPLEHRPFEPGGLASPLDEVKGMKQKLEEALRGMLGDSAGDIVVCDGDVAGKILHYREFLGADLVVMGSRGRTGLSHVLVGSVAERVARFCESPVWTVK